MIRLIKGYPYDNSYDYIKLHSSKSAQNSFFSSFSSLLIDGGAEEGYCREGSNLYIDFNYDFLVSEGVNYVIWNNGFKDLYCFITNKEYVDEETTMITYEIDVINTYLFDFDLKKSFVERKVCSISEITDFDEGIEIGEHEIVENNICFNKEYDTFAMFSGFKDYMVNSEGTKFDTIPLIDDSKPITDVDGVKYPILFIALNNAISITNFNKYLSNQPNLLGVIKMPKGNYSTTTMKLPIIEMVDNKIVTRKIDCPQVVTFIERSDKISTTYGVSKSNITDFFPYTYYILTDGETEPLILKPQYLPSSFSVKGRIAMGYTPVERYYPTSYKNSNDGTLYNITNTSVMMLPCASNGGLETLVANVNTIQQQKISTMTSVLGSATLAIGGAITGNPLAIGGAIVTGANGINSIRENIARNKEIELCPNSVKSVGTVNTRDSFYTNNVRLIKMSIKDNMKSRLLNFVERYGNKFNNYATIDLKTYKGYIKFNAPDIDTKIDNIYSNKIIAILERGIKIE